MSAKEWQVGDDVHYCREWDEAPHLGTVVDVLYRYQVPGVRALVVSHDAEVCGCNEGNTVATIVDLCDVCEAQ